MSFLSLPLWPMPTLGLGAGLGQVLRAAIVMYYHNHGYLSYWRVHLRGVQHPALEGGGSDLVYSTHFKVIRSWLKGSGPGAA